MTRDTYLTVLVPY